MTDWLSVRFFLLFISPFLFFLYSCVRIYETDWNDVRPFLTPLVRVRGCCWMLCRREATKTSPACLFFVKQRGRSPTVNLTKTHRPFRRSLFLSVPRKPPTHDTYSYLCALCCPTTSAQSSILTTENRERSFFFLLYDFCCFPLKKFSVPPCDVLSSESRHDWTPMCSPHEITWMKRGEERKQKPPWWTTPGISTTD